MDQVQKMVTVFVLKTRPKLALEVVYELEEQLSTATPESFCCGHVIYIVTFT